MIKGNCLLDLYMKERNIFPNSYMEEVENTPELKEKKYDIYYILSGDKYIISQYIEAGHVLEVEILNCTTYKRVFAHFDIGTTFRVPDTSYLSILIIDRGSMLKITYKDKGVEYLKENDTFAYDIYCERTKGGENFECLIHAKSLFDRQMQSDGKEFMQEYEVLYIGQSKRKNIFDRLKNHSTLQKIMRDKLREGDNKELYVLIQSVGIKRFVQQNFEIYNSLFVFGNKLNAEEDIAGGINNDDIINIAEALLISHFKPHYNEKLVKDDGLEKLSTYRRIGDAEVNPIALSVDLFWEESGEQMILYTSETKTTTKGRYLECYFENNKINITYEDVPDYLY